MISFPGKTIVTRKTCLSLSRSLLYVTGQVVVLCHPELTILSQEESQGNGLTWIKSSNISPVRCLLFWELLSTLLGAGLSSPLVKSVPSWETSFKLVNNQRYFLRWQSLVPSPSSKPLVHGGSLNSRSWGISSRILIFFLFVREVFPILGYSF